MASKVLDRHEELLVITLRKSELLQSVAKHLDDITSNPIFVDEVHEAFMDLDEEESALLIEKRTTLECPGCGFECGQIHTYCMVCGTRLHDDQYRGTM